MMELISDSFDIRCRECGEQITIFKDDLERMFRSTITAKMVWVSKQSMKFIMCLAVPDGGTTLKSPLLATNIPKVHMIMIAQKYPVQSSSKHLRWEWFITKMNLMLTRKLLKLRVSAV